MGLEHPRMRREERTIGAMVEIYCRGKHGTKNALCSDCQALLEYARKRLQKCPFQEDKPACSKCPVHCYQPAMREHVRDVMRYAGPRMLFRHPWLAIQHLVFDERRSPPDRRRGRRNGRNPVRREDG